jgi:hypothetical protein
VVGGTALNQAGNLRRDLDGQVSGQVGARQTDHDQDAAGGDQSAQPEESRTSVHVMQRGDGADQVEVFRRQLGGIEVPDDVRDVTALGMASATLDTRFVSVQAEYFGDAAAVQLTGELPVATADVESSSAAVWDGIEHHGLVPGTHGSEA